MTEAIALCSEDVDSLGFGAQLLVSTPTRNFAKTVNPAERCYEREVQSTLQSDAIPVKWQAWRGSAPVSLELSQGRYREPLGIREFVAMAVIFCGVAVVRRMQARRTS